MQISDHFTGIGIFLDTCVFCTSIYSEPELTGVSWRRYKNDLDSDYSFPRVVAMQGDGKTSYDVGKDGVPTMIGDCTVRADVFGMSLRFPTNGTGRLSPHRYSDKAQGQLCQGHGIGRTSTHAFLDSNPHFQYAFR
jgi:hypothetical protein